jgi:hypothetical protein
MLMSSVELRPEEGCAGDAQQNHRLYFSSERAPHINKNCLKVINERLRKIGRWFQMGV